MDTMKLIGAEMKDLGAIDRDPLGFDTKLVHKAAKELSQHAARIPELFPKGSNQKPCEARKEIWFDWDRFLKIANDLKEAANEFQKVNAETFKPTFLKSAKTCKGCHQDFRQKKN